MSQMVSQKAFILLFFLLSVFKTVAQDAIKIEKIVILENINNFQNPNTNAIIYPENNEIKLKYNQNSLLIFFKSETKPPYSYMLKGFNNRRAFQTLDNKLLLTSLSNGEYNLTIENLANKAVKPAYLKISIESPIWLRWWFLPMMFVYAVFLIAIILYFLFQFRLRQQGRTQAVKYELEIKILRAQMNPHFIFNAINTIDASILEKRFIEASDLLQKFSELIRITLENSQFTTIAIADELKTLDLYIQLEQERFPDIFTYQFEVQTLLLEKNYQIPPLLLQPFVENAILHGFRGLENRKGLLKIILKVEPLSPQLSANLKQGKRIEAILLCRIEDNGIGRKASKIINKHDLKKHKSMGLDITFERIKKYQDTYHVQADTQITDLQGDNTGTIIEFRLPLIIS